MHIKHKLEKKAIDQRLISPKKSSTFWGREIRPFFQDKYQGSSSEEEEEDEEGMVRKGKEMRRQLRREKRAEKAFISQKLNSPSSAT